MTQGGEHVTLGDVREQLCSLRRAGASTRTLAQQFGVSEVFMRNVLNGNKRVTRRMLEQMGIDPEPRYRRVV